MVKFKFELDANQSATVYAALMYAAGAMATTDTKQAKQRSAECTKLAEDIKRSAKAQTTALIADAIMNGDI